MGLYMNTGTHPGVFKNKSRIEGKNQRFYRKDYFSELLKEQQNVNSTLIHTLNELKILHYQQLQKQEGQWKETDNRLKKLNERNLKHQHFENNALKRLHLLDEKSIQLQGALEKEGFSKQEMMDQIVMISESNQEIMTKLAQYESSTTQITEHVHEMIDLQKQMTAKVVAQDEHQDEVVSRLETQEALMEKTLRQITNFRSILFERTNHLAEKIESSYDLTSSYIYKLLTGSEQPLTLLMKKEDNQKKVD